MWEKEHKYMIQVIGLIVSATFFLQPNINQTTRNLDILN